jgi:hypothetical protein
MKNLTSSQHTWLPPHWAQKLMMPAFFKEEKVDKMMKQWKLKLGLELIKMRHAVVGRVGDKEQYKQFKNEIMEYIAYANDQVQQDELKDVYVTDHKPKAKKYITLGSDEDQAFYKYTQELKNYNDE